MRKLLMVYSHENEEYTQCGLNEVRKVIGNGFEMMQSQNLLGYNEMCGEKKFKKPYQLLIINWDLINADLDYFEYNGFLRIMASNGKLWIEDWAVDYDEDVGYYKFHYSTLSEEERRKLYKKKPLNRYFKSEFFWDEDYEE
jgi:hypothetical protein